MSEDKIAIIKIICRCHCGAKIRIPKNAKRNYLCPKCYDPVSIEKHATGDPPVVVKVPRNDTKSMHLPSTKKEQTESASDTPPRHTAEHTAKSNMPTSNQPEIGNDYGHLIDDQVLGTNIDASDIGYETGVNPNDEYKSLLFDQVLDLDSDADIYAQQEKRPAEYDLKEDSWL